MSLLNSVIISSIAFKFFIVVVYNFKSSTKNKLVRLIDLYMELPTVYPLHCFSIIDKGLTDSMKSITDRVSPCKIPLAKLIVSDSIVQLMLCIRSMVAQLFVNDFTAFIISVGILASSKALISQECGTESNAF